MVATQNRCLQGYRAATSSLHHPPPSALAHPSMSQEWLVVSRVPLLYVIPLKKGANATRTRTCLHLPFLIRFCWLCGLCSRIFQALFAAVQEDFRHIKGVQFT